MRNTLCISTTQSERISTGRQDSRTIGTFLAKSHPQLDVYYLSETDTMYHLKPEPMFLLVSEVKPAFPSSSVILQTPTQALYLIQ